MFEFDVNWLAVIVVALADMVLGSLWYSPLILGKQWMSAIGKRPEELGNPRDAMITAALVSLLTAFVLAVLVGSLEVVSLGTGAFLGFLVWLGFVVTSGFLTQAFEGRSPVVNGIFLAYRLVALLLMGAILGAWS